MTNYLLTWTIFNFYNQFLLILEQTYFVFEKMPSRRGWDGWIDGCMDLCIIYFCIFGPQWFIWRLFHPRKCAHNNTFEASSCWPHFLLFPLVAAFRGGFPAGVQPQDAAPSIRHTATQHPVVCAPPNPTAPATAPAATAADTSGCGTGECHPVTLCLPWNLLAQE